MHFQKQNKFIVDSKKKKFYLENSKKIIYLNQELDSIASLEVS